MTPLANVMAAALSNTSGFPYRQEAYRAGLEDAYKWLAEFPTCAIHYRAGSGISHHAVEKAVSPGYVVPLDFLEDIRIVPMDVAGLKAAMAEELRKVLWPGLNTNPSATPDEKE